MGALNNALEQTPDEETRNRTLEAREEFQSKYQNHFRKEAEKTTMFRQMNLEKSTTDLQIILALLGAQIMEQNPTATRGMTGTF